MKCICGHTAHTHGKEMDYAKNSKVADIKIANWIVAVKAMGAMMDGKDRICGGVVITSKHIITSAHCLYDESRSEIFYHLRFS